MDQDQEQEKRLHPENFEATNIQREELQSMLEHAAAVHAFLAEQVASMDKLGIAGEEPSEEDYDESDDTDQ